jgi:hypothetical protein
MILVFVLVASPASADDGYLFFGAGVAGNSSGDMIQVEQQALPQLTFEWAYPLSGSVSAGFEISGAFYGHSTDRWGDERGFGAALGSLVVWEVNDRWFLTTGGGWLLSNPLSDSASGEYMEGHEGNPDAQVVREPIQVLYVRGTVGYRLNHDWAVQVGVRNLSPYASVGYSW